MNQKKISIRENIKNLDTISVDAQSAHPAKIERTNVRDIYLEPLLEYALVRKKRGAA